MGTGNVIASILFAMIFGAILALRITGRKNSAQKKVPSVIMETSTPTEVLKEAEAPKKEVAKSSGDKVKWYTSVLSQVFLGIIALITISALGWFVYKDPENAEMIIIIVLTLISAFVFISSKDKYVRTISYTLMTITVLGFFFFGKDFPRVMHWLQTNNATSVLSGTQNQNEVPNQSEPRVRIIARDVVIPAHGKISVPREAYCNGDSLSDEQMLFIRRNSNDNGAVSYTSNTSEEISLRIWFFPGKGNCLEDYQKLHSQGLFF